MRWCHPAAVLGMSWGMRPSAISGTSHRLPRACPTDVPGLHRPFCSHSLKQTNSQTVFLKKLRTDRFISINNLPKYPPQPFTTIVNLDHGSSTHLPGAHSHLLQVCPNICIRSGPPPTAGPSTCFLHSNNCPTFLHTHTIIILFV